MYINQERGKIGENLACKYLEENGYEILERNYRCRQGEIDIVAQDKRTKEIVFIEVKARSNLKYGRPAEAVQQEKQKHIVDVAKYYIYKKGITHLAFRFDVMEVFLSNSNYKIHHIEKAFFKK